MIKYVKGDVLDSNADVIMHGVNCSNGFASGVAGQIADKYPRVKAAYHNKYTSERWKLGEVQFVAINSTQVIANCATQQQYGLIHHGPYVNYDAIYSVIRKVLLATPSKNIIAMPKIGAGLAGGNWEIIEKIVNEASGTREILVYTLE